MAPAPAPPPVRPGTPWYRQRQEQHESIVSRYGIVCQSTPELETAAHEYAERVWRTSARPNASPRDRYGRPRTRHNFQGQVGAELFARHFGLTADWTVYDNRDRGWDVLLWGTQGQIRVDVKTRQSWLVIPEQDGVLHLSPASDLLALVQHADGSSQYILCGVITPQRFRQYCFRVDFGAERSWAVTATDLEPIAYFASRLSSR